MVVKKSIKMTQKLNKPIIGLVENMSSVVCPHCGNQLEVFGPSTGAEVAADMGIPYLGSLKWDPRIIDLVDQGKIEDYDLTSVEDIITQVLVRTEEVS